jgi:NAD(P)-dependent dehydrogenase (short-subunit alcohol dehydrogenase family)
MQLELSQKVALITGAGTGIGRAAAILLAEHGARVSLVGRRMDKLAEVADQIESAGGQAPVTTGGIASRALVAPADVADPDQIRRAVEQTVARFGRLDIVFANAGINGVWCPVEEMTVEEWGLTLDANLKGTFLTVKYAVPHLKKQGGSIVICSSVNGTRQFSLSGASAYATSKAGQAAFAKMIALELARWKVRVNVICPGSIETDLGRNTWKRNLDAIRVPRSFPQGSHPLAGKSGEAVQVARLVLFLASDAADHITGTEVWIDGGESLLIG